MMSCAFGMFCCRSAIDRKLDPEFLEHGLRLEIGGPERDGLAVAERPVVNDLNDRIGPSNADVEYRHDVAILGNDVVVAEPCEIEHVGNTWQWRDGSWRGGPSLGVRPFVFAGRDVHPCTCPAVTGFEGFST